MPRTDYAEGMHSWRMIYLNYDQSSLGNICQLTMEKFFSMEIYNLWPPLLSVPIGSDPQKSKCNDLTKKTGESWSFYRNQLCSEFVKQVKPSLGRNHIGDPVRKINHRSFFLVVTCYLVEVYADCRISSVLEVFSFSYLLQSVAFSMIYWPAPGEGRGGLTYLPPTTTTALCEHDST